METLFDHKTIIISGIARGIGKALALQAAQFDMCVAGIDIRENELKDLAKELDKKSCKHHLKVVDIRDAESCKKFIDECQIKFGSIDFLINNAGITHIAPESETSIATTQNLMDINFMGTVHLSHYALPHLLKSKGTLAGVSSVAGYSPLLYRTAYAASKHAVWGYLASLRTELKPQGVQVLTICPSFVHTELQEDQQAYFKNSTKESLTPTWVAGEIFLAITNKKEIALIGKTAKRVYWLNRLFPSLYEKIMFKKTKI